MTEEMIQAARKLLEAARDYRELYETEYREEPVIWIKLDETGEGVFIADSFNTELIKSRVGGI